MADGSVETHPLTHDPLIVRPEGFFFVSSSLRPRPLAGKTKHGPTHTHNAFAPRTFFVTTPPFSYENNQKNKKKRSRQQRSHGAAGAESG